MKKIAFLIAVVFLLAGCTSNSFPSGTRWEGEYRCRQGITNLELKILEDKVGLQKAIFSFYHVPSGVKGSFYMAGRYDPETNEMILSPAGWIKQPCGYMPVGMKGLILRNPIRYEGLITAEGCGAFSLRLMPGRGFLETLFYHLGISN